MSRRPYHDRFARYNLSDLEGVQLKVGDHSHKHFTGGVRRLI